MIGVMREGIIELNLYHDNTIFDFSDLVCEVEKELNKMLENNVGKLEEMLKPNHTHLFFYLYLSMRISQLQYIKDSINFISARESDTLIMHLLKTVAEKNSIDEYTVIDSKYDVDHMGNALVKNALKFTIEVR